MREINYKTNCKNCPKVYQCALDNEANLCKIKDKNIEKIKMNEKKIKINF